MKLTNLLIDCFSSSSLASPPWPASTSLAPMLLLLLSDTDFDSEEGNLERVNSEGLVLDPLLFLLSFLEGFVVWARESLKASMILSRVGGWERSEDGDREEGEVVGDGWQGRWGKWVDGSFMVDLISHDERERLKMLCDPTFFMGRLEVSFFR